MTVEELKSLITVEEVKSYVPKDILESITFSSESFTVDDSVIERAINIAAQKLFLKLRKCGKSELTSDEKEIAKLYLLKDAIYQLYAMNETENISTDKLQEARQILKDWLGDCGNEEPKKITTIKVVRYERKSPF
ncbi:hypothetical protein [Desulfurobacterium crinifex]